MRRVKCLRVRKLARLVESEVIGRTVGGELNRGSVTCMERVNC